MHTYQQIAFVELFCVWFFLLFANNVLHVVQFIAVVSYVFDENLTQIRGEMVNVFKHSVIYRIICLLYWY